MTIRRDSFSVIAGPCAAESREQMLETARAAADGGAAMLRAGAWKPRTSPHSFQGLGEEGRLRVTYGTRQENDRFLAALEEVL